jgi:hypothetical protein
VYHFSLPVPSGSEPARAARVPGFENAK